MPGQPNAGGAATTGGSMSAEDFDRLMYYGSLPGGGQNNGTIGRALVPEPTPPIRYDPRRQPEPRRYPGGGGFREGEGPSGRYGNRRYTGGGGFQEGTGRPRYGYSQNPFMQWIMSMMGGMNKGYGYGRPMSQGFGRMGGNMPRNRYSAGAKPEKY